MKKFNVVAASAVALSAALASGSALAHGTLATSLIKYNAAQVTAAGGTITVPWSGLASAVYTVTANGATTTSLEVNSRFTVTLPAGFTFFSQPALNPSSGATSTSLISGGIGSQTATFTIGAPPPGNNALGQGSTLTLTQVSVQGATALETPGTSLSISVQAVSNSLISNNDAAPVFATNATFLSTTGVNSTFASTAAQALSFIDLRSPTFGTLFLNPAPVGDSANTDLGTLTLTQDGSLGANGAVATVSTADAVTITINGFFNGIKGSFSTVGGTGCGGTVTSAGTATASSVSVPGASAVAPGGNDICITANGSTLLSPNGNFTAAYAPGAGATDFLGGNVSSTTDAITYTGGTVVPVTNFLTGSDAGYTSLVRVNNASNVLNTLFAVAQPYSGGPTLVGSLGSIGAGTGTVFTEAQIGTATGLSLANSGQRATLSLIATPGPGGINGVQAAGLLVNPGGMVDQVNQ
jgi:hypothetical protein